MLNTWLGTGNVYELLFAHLSTNSNEVFSALLSKSKKLSLIAKANFSSPLTVILRRYLFSAVVALTSLGTMLDSKDSKNL